MPLSLTQPPVAVVVVHLDDLRELGVGRSHLHLFERHPKFPGLHEARPVRVVLLEHKVGERAKRVLADSRAEVLGHAKSLCSDGRLLSKRRDLA